MKWTTPRWNCFVAMMVFVALFSCATLAVAEPPAAPKVSTFAPAQDLVGQVDFYMGRLKDSVADEASFKDAVDGQLGRDANTMIVIALALGVHDEDNQYKASAPAMVEAAQKLAAAKDFAAGKAAFAELEKASKAKAGGEVKWEKAASLEALMKQVPMINTRVKKDLKRLEKKEKEVAGGAAAMAVIAVASMPNVDETTKPEAAAEWYKFCEEMRDAAAALNKAAHAKDKSAADKSVATLTKACDDCHAVFKPDAVGK